MHSRTQKPLSQAETIVTQKLQKPDDIKEYAEKNWSASLSDHLAQILPLTKECYLISWNIMAWGNGRNNAYQKTESKDEYNARLARIVKELGYQLKTNTHIALATLQEVPENQNARIVFIELLLEELLPQKNWVIDENLYQRSEGNNFGLLTFFNSDKIETDPVKVSIDGLYQQQGRVLAVDMTLRENQLPIRLVNAHFRYKDKNFNKTTLTVAEAQIEIDTIFKSTPKQVIIAADFNQDIHQISSQYQGRTFYSREASSVSYKKGQLIEKNIDGFILKHNKVC